MKIDEEFKTYLQVIWLYKWIILACAIIASIGALGISLQLTPLYSAMATVRVASASVGASDYSYISSLTRLSNTYVEIANSDIILNKVAERLGMQKKPKVEVEIVPETELITIKSSDPDPARARDIANTLAGLMVEQSMQLYGGNAPTARQILEGQLQQAKADLDSAVDEYNRAFSFAQSSSNSTVKSTPNADVEALAHLVSVRQQIYGDLLQRYEEARMSEQLRANAVTIVENAPLPLKPSSPKIPLNAALGLLAGLTMGVILAFIFEGMDDTLRGIDDVRALTKLPILCMVPDLKQEDRFPEGDNPPAPAFDQLSARLIVFEAKSNSTKFLLSSPEPGAGKSTVAANLAVSLAQGGKRVVLVDMDLRRPRVHSILNLPNEKGFRNFLRGEIQADETMQNTTRSNLRVVTIGSSPNIPFEWLTSVKIVNFIETLGYDCDYVLIDGPALLSVGDPMVLASQVDAVIMVVARRQTERKNFRYALQQLADIKAKVAGIVINRGPNSQLYKYYSRRDTKSNSLAGSGKTQTE
jgi:polysaccharide biosynthesis transport protein